MLRPDPNDPDPHQGHTPGDGYGPDVDPVTGDEAETEELTTGDNT